MNSTATLTTDSINSSDTNITSTPAISRMSRLLRRCLGAVMITTIGVGAALTAGAAPASAWSYGASTGTPGAVTVPVIYVGDLAYGYTLYGNTPVTAYRVAGTTGIQTVLVAYRVERFVNGQWVLGAQTILNRTMAANQSSVQFPAPYFNPTVARGYQRFVFIFAWANSSGVTVGAVAVNPSVVSDHVCVTPVRLCQSYAGYFRTGGYRTGQW